MAYNKEYYKLYYSKNRERVLALNRAWHLKNKDRRKTRQLQCDRQSKYGTTPEDIEVLIQKQNNQCAICQTSLGYHSMHVDHCHTTGKVRGLLCSSCNKGLGHFKDSMLLLNKAYLYIKEQEDDFKDAVR